MSSSNTASKLEREKSKLIQEKCQSLLNEMLRDEDNKYCVDCDAKGPRWASWNLGIFLCIRCAGIHRNLGVHISRVKSVNLDTWTPEQVVTMQHMGNSRARAVYEANMPDNFRRPQTDVALENFIRAKYEHKKYIAQEWVQPSIAKVNWDSEIEESLRKKREAKKHSEGVINLPSIPKPKTTATNQVTASTPRPQNPPKITAAHAALAASAQNNNSASTEANTKPKNPSDDLFGLMGGDDLLSGGAPMALSSDPFASPLKNVETTTAATSAADDLGGLFTSPSNGTNFDPKKMTKESILSLYGQGTAAPNSVPQQANPFAAANMFNANPVVGGAPANNPFPQFPSQHQQHAFNPNMMQTPQGGLGFNPYMANAQPAGLGIGGNPTQSNPSGKDLNSLFNFQPELTQMQNQMQGMNLFPGTGPVPMSTPNTGANNLLGNLGSMGLQGLTGSTPGAMPSQFGQSKNPGPFF